MDVLELLRTYEEKLLDGNFRKNSDEVGRLTSDDFLEFGKSGRVFSKSTIIASLQEETSAPIEMQDFSAEMLGDTVALLTYRAIRRELGAPAIESLRSSIWIYRNGQWMVRFHQGTRTAASEAA